MATHTAASSSSSSRKYDVFLSFCGVDSRKNFTDHLFTALEKRGINTFRDDEKLVRGKYISPELLKAIEVSEYALIVLSRNYAFSRWCLIELAKIVECIEETKLAWKAVLKEVGNISGWHLNDRHESIVIQEILRRISSELDLIVQSTISNNLVGIESRVKELLVKQLLHK